MSIEAKKLNVLTRLGSAVLCLSLASTAVEACARPQQPQAQTAETQSGPVQPPSTPEAKVVFERTLFTPTITATPRPTETKTPTPTPRAEPSPTRQPTRTPTRRPVARPTPTAVVSETPVKKINISGVFVNDFLRSAKQANKEGDLLLIDIENYHILYFPRFNKFLISILSSPFVEIKKEAEGDFIKTLGISQTDACRLPVEVTTPFFANPDYSGAIYTLGFCRTKQ